ncbi:MAG: CBS domain-containing protein, partial [Acidobacteriota bacterium]
MGTSEFDEAYEDEPGRHEREEGSLGQAILEATIEDLEPKPAATLREMGTIRAAVHLMLEQKLGAVLVERDGQTVGIFTERDLMRRVVAAGIDLDRAIEEVMTPEPETLRLDDRVAFALNRMAVGGFRNVPIV